MSDNVYNPEPTLGEWLNARNRAYLLGIDAEQDRLSESLDEYIETEVYGGCQMSDQDQEVLQAFVDWHLSGEKS